MAGVAAAWRDAGRDTDAHLGADERGLAPKSTGPRDDRAAARRGGYAPRVDDGQGLALGLLAAGAWGLTDVTAAVLSRRVGSLRATAWAQLTTLVVLGGLLLLTGTALPADPVVVAAALGCGVVGGVAYLTFFTALRHGPITVVSPVVSMYGGLSVVLAVVLLGETVGPVQALGTGVAVMGVVLVSVVVDPAGRRPRLVGPGVIYALWSLVAFALLTVALSPVIDAGGWLPVLVLARLANASTAWGVLAGSRMTGRWSGRTAAADLVVAVPLGEVAEPGPSDRGGAVPRRAAGVGLATVSLGILAGLLDVSGFIAFAIGLEIAPTWLVGITSSFGPVVAVAAGVALFGERPRRVQWVGLGMVLASVILIGFG